MDFVPLHCASCSCFYLESAHLVIEQHALCECGGIARELAGERYSAADATLFDAIVTSLRVGDVSALHAQVLAEALHGRDALAPGEALVRLVELEPALAAIALIATSEPRLARKAESIFATLLTAIGAGRSRSGILSREVHGEPLVARGQRRR